MTLINVAERIMLTNYTERAGASIPTLTPTYPDLAGKVAVVTGGSRGIGAAICRLLAANGVKVVVNGRDEEAIDAVIREINFDCGQAVHGRYQSDRYLSHRAELFTRHDRASPRLDHHNGLNGWTPAGPVIGSLRRGQGGHCDVLAPCSQ
jgi:hypothetical protein